MFEAVCTPDSSFFFTLFSAAGNHLEAGVETKVAQHIASKEDGRPATVVGRDDRVPSSCFQDAELFEFGNNLLFGRIRLDIGTVDGDLTLGSGDGASFGLLGDGQLCFHNIVGWFQLQEDPIIIGAKVHAFLFYFSDT